MTDDLKWPVQIASLGPSSAGTMLWRRGGQLHLTVLVKVTFGLAPGGIMAPVDPIEIRRVELHHGDNPTRSIRAPSELWPFLPGAEVLFTGHAHCPEGQEEQVLPVRLSLLRNRKIVLDKTLLVFGDRTPPARGEAPPEPQPFQRMPLVYERAYGGIGSPDNPHGVGYGSKPGKKMPNIVHPTKGPEQMAGLGPISCFVPARKRLLHGHPRKLLEGRIAELPDEVDPTYFHAAPEDQRLPRIFGDELIALEHLNAALPRLETRLPQVSAAARIYTPDGVELALGLDADMLLIDGDREVCSLVFRGNLPVHDESLLPDVTVLGAFSLSGEPIRWPTPEERRAQGTPSPVPSAAASRPADFSVTQTLDDADVEPVDALDAPTAMLPVDMLLPGGLTLSLDAEPTDHGNAPKIAETPVDPPAPAVSRWEGTYVLNDAESSAASSFQAPFAVPPPGSSSPGGAAPIPGAPFAPPPRGRLKTIPLVEVHPFPSPSASVIYPSFDDDDDEDNMRTQRINIAVQKRIEDPPTQDATMDLMGPGEVGVGAPFPLSEPGLTTPASAPLPGAPWGPAAEPAPDSDDEAGETINLKPVRKVEPEVTVEPAAPPPAIEPAPPEVAPPLPAIEPAPAPVAAPEPAPAKPDAPAANGWSWATVAGSEKEIAERDAKPRPPPAPKPAVKGALYGKFAGKK
ncbi:MAG: DUF2169 domain-containing protein [Byssovorax sp.]